MTQRRTRWALVLPLALVALVLAACETEPAEDIDEDVADAEDSDDNGEVAVEGGERDDIEIVMITHGQAADPFWTVAVNGAEVAAEDLGIDFTYQAPDEFDMVEMSSLIDAAVADEPDGIAVSIPDADGLEDAINSAVEADIPVVSLNSGDDVYEEMGVLAHVGQSEELAGYEGGAELADAGATNALCVNHEQGNVALDLRCEGFLESMEEAGAEAGQLAVEGTDAVESQERIEAALIEDDTIDGILALGPLGADPAINALEEQGMTDDVAIGTFDLGPDILDAVDAGDMLFAIDQQQYLQGYLPVHMLTQQAETGTMPVGEVLTGPGFVFQEDAADVMDLTEEGLR
ncbi:sugar ABC transporter substrate-binding protein [Egibacter rhizosphaerae]|uniref:Sugar ABC transporter substrate-binding protein n=1 Tax=Egibacter rhizosphaerae TaxID=1670831 RepID=A0A411YE89_9ACTN|nr:sugar ABC transporter substrate-binding protein [Egibacter rhizosphaerae]QBI19500.1 sugar ABC transporter substrate-binding protein [Egibacter rhizosphaerae]